MAAPPSPARGFPWAASVALALPGPAACVVAGVFGLRHPTGIGILAAALVWHVVSLLWLQPNLARRVAQVSPTDLAVQRFLQRSLEVADLEDVAAELAEAVATALGPTQGLLIAPSADGGVRVLSGRRELPVDVGDASSAFLWLGDSVEPLHRSELVRSEGEGARQALALLDRLGGEVLLPLRHRGLLLGLGLIGPPAQPTDDRLPGFYRALRAFAAVAIANCFLDAEARGRGDLAQTLGLATAVQEALMPGDRPVRRPRFTVRGLFRPVAECGGDLWVWRELAGERVLLVIADATGHGAAPALLSAVAKGTIDAHWQLFSGDLDPGRLLAGVNRAVYRTGRRRYMMTAFAAVIDTVEGRVRFANAGQNFPILISGRGLEPLIARGDTLGAATEARYQVHERKLELGDRLLLFTDGLIEAGSPHSEPWGERRFRAALAQAADARAARIPEILLGRLDEYLAGRAISDDVTVVAFELGGEASEA